MTHLVSLEALTCVTTGCVDTNALPASVRSNITFVDICGRIVEK